MMLVAAIQPTSPSAGRASAEDAGVGEAEHGAGAGAVGCSGGPQVDGPDYHHVSSIAAGNDANILVASRELATVWSFAHDGGGVQWVLSSRLRSDFRFAKRADEFYEPHDVRQLPNGDLTMIDDGSSRPGCFQDSTALCFSRAICYRFDRARRVVDVVWQFAFPLQPNAAPWRAVMGADVYNNLSLIHI